MGQAISLAAHYRAHAVVFRLALELGVSPKEAEAVLAQRAARARWEESSRRLEACVHALQRTSCAAAAVAGSSDATGLAVIAQNTAAKALKDSSGSVVHCSDYGVVGDDVANDTIPINACIAAFKARINSSAGNHIMLPVSMVLPAGIYRLSGGLNFTGIQALGATVHMEGAILDCHITNVTCVDALGSRWLTFYGMHIIQKQSGSQPRIGLAYGRNSAAVADQNIFYDLVVDGYFSFTAVYNLASETSDLIHPFIDNETTTGGTYAIVMDGINHWAVTSVFTTTTAPVNTYTSFNENLIVGGSFYAYGPASAIMWIAAPDRLRILNSWGSSSGYGIVMYTAPAYPTVRLYADFHFEGTLTDTFLFDSPASTVINTYGLTYIDGGTNTTEAVFKLSANVTSAQVFDLDLQLGSISGSPIPVLFQPAQWTNIIGDVHLPISGNFTWAPTASTFWGCLTSANVKSCNYNGALTASGGISGPTGTFTTTVSAPSVINPSNSRPILISGGPSITSGFGTGAAMSNGTSNVGFAFNVGTSPTTSGVLGMGTTAAHAGWNCFGRDTTSPTLAIVPVVTATGTTSVTISFYNYTSGAGVLTAPNASDIITLSCFPN